MDLRRIVRATESDPFWAGDVVRSAGSPIWGLSSPPAGVGEALEVLGLRRFFQLATVASVGPLLEVRLPHHGLAAGALWDHSMAVALATREILLEKGLKPCEEAFTAAIVHDVGKLLPEPAAGSGSDRPARHGGDVRMPSGPEALDHAEAGAELLERWKMPPWLVASVRRHHAAAEDSSMIAELVGLAEDLCQGAGVAAGDDGARSEGLPDLARRWSLSGRSVARIQARTLAMLAELGEPAVRGEGR